MSTEMTSREPAGGVTPDDQEELVSGGELFIRDLPKTATRPPASAQSEKDSGKSGGEDDYDDEGEEGIVTTMMLGEEGDRGGGDDDQDKKEGDGIVTTMMLGEEGS